jgi:hypothetical protein
MDDYWNKSKMFVCLRHAITENGNRDTVIRKRVQMAKGTYINIKSILTSKQITDKLKMRVIKFYVYSILLNGAESWTLNKLMEDKINAFEMLVYRQIEHISRQKTTNIIQC